MASRRSSRSREDYRHARDPLDHDCRPVLCIRDDDCKISLKSYGGSQGINLSEIQNCFSGGPLKEACQVLVRQLGAFSQHVYDRGSRVAESQFDEITFVGDNSTYKIRFIWSYGGRHDSLLPQVYIRSLSGAGSLSISSGKVSIGTMPRNGQRRRLTWTTLIGSGVVASIDDVNRAEMIWEGLYSSGRLRGDIEYNARRLQGGQQKYYLDGGFDRMTLRFGKSRDQIMIPP